jgi:hypothetical protein
MTMRSGVGSGSNGARGRLLWAGLLLLLAVGSCVDGGPLLYPPPAEIVVDLASGMEGRAGEVVPASPLVTVRDRHGNALPGVRVVVTVEAGGGSVANPNQATGNSGRVQVAGWRMGPQPGPNRIAIQVAGVETVHIEVMAGPGLPDRVTFLEDLPETGEVASTFTDLPRVRVTDQFGTPVPGVEVRFEPTQGGSVTESVAVTGSDGVFELPDWTLAETAGLQRLNLIPNEGPSTWHFQVQALPGPPAALEFTSSEDQRVEVGLFLPHPPVVEVTDEFGNGIPGMPVEFSVLEGGGRLEGVDEVTDALGQATAQRWHMGSEPGENVVEARVPGFPPATLAATAVGPDAEPVGRYFEVAAVHVNQANQDIAGGIPLIEGRPGLLRVWVRSTESGAPAPAARLRVYDGEALIGDTLLTPASAIAPISIDPLGGSPSLDFHLEGDRVGPGLRVEVEVDPDHEVGVVTRRYHAYPMDGGGGFDTVRPDVFRALFVSLQDNEETDVVGTVTEERLDQFMDQTRRMLPLAEDSVWVGEPFVTNLLDSLGAVQNVLPAMRSAWLASEPRNYYFHGIFPRDVPLNFGGLAYRPTNPENPAPIAMSHDRLPGASSTVAHEFGHNLGIRHAPCGNPPGVDTSYPYPDGRIGPHGYDVVDRSLISGTNSLDVMSYCSPRWISDYNFDMMLEWRLAAPGGAPGMVAGGGPPAPGLLLWGRINASGAVLEPALPVTARPFMPAREGSYRIRGLDADGRELFSFRFEADEVAHAPDPTERHFGWVMPLPEEVRRDLDRLELDAPEGQAAQWSRAAPVDLPRMGPAAAAVRPEPAGDMLEWDTDLFPTAWVRSIRSGRIVGMVRNGRLDLTRWDGEVELLLSDGVRGWVPGASGVTPGAW